MTRRHCRRRGRTACAVLLFAGLLPVTRGADAATPTARTWWVHRTSAKATPLKLRVTIVPRASPEANEGTVLAVESTGRGRSRKVHAYDIGGVGRDPLVRSYGTDGVPNPSCADVCEVANGTGLFDAWLEIDRSASTSEWFVAAQHLDVRVTASRGWRVEPMANRLTVVDGARSDATGARSNNVTVEHFTSARAPGGRYGSFAFAVIPCTTAGAGSARLRGASELYVGGSTLGCLTYDATRTAAVAHGATRWDLTGDVVGTSSWQERLTVFSFPW